MKTFNTLDYYDRHAKAFYESTVHVEFGATQRRFFIKASERSAYSGFWMRLRERYKIFYRAGV